MHVDKYRTTLVSRNKPTLDKPVPVTYKYGSNMFTISHQVHMATNRNFCTTACYCGSQLVSKRGLERGVKVGIFGTAIKLSISFSPPWPRFTPLSSRLTCA